MNEPQDEFAGQGGSYTLDPKTGKRKLVERTAPAPSGGAGPAQPQPQPQAQAAPAEAEATLPPSKAKKE